MIYHSLTVLHGSISHPAVNTKFGGRESGVVRGGFPREDSESDCLSDRAAVLDEQLVSQQHLFTILRRIIP